MFGQQNFQDQFGLFANLSKSTSAFAQNSVPQNSSSQSLPQPTNTSRLFDNGQINGVNTIISLQELSTPANTSSLQGNELIIRENKSQVVSTNPINTYNQQYYTQNGNPNAMGLMQSLNPSSNSGLYMRMDSKVQQTEILANAAAATTQTLLTGGFALGRAITDGNTNKELARLNLKNTKIAADAAKEAYEAQLKIAIENYKAEVKKAEINAETEKRNSEERLKIAELQNETAKLNLVSNLFTTKMTTNAAITVALNSNAQNIENGAHLASVVNINHFQQNDSAVQVAEMISSLNKTLINCTASKNKQNNPQILSNTETKLEEPEELDKNVDETSSTMLRRNP